MAINDSEFFLEWNIKEVSCIWYKLTVRTFMHFKDMYAYTVIYIVFKCKTSQYFRFLRIYYTYHIKGRINFAFDSVHLVYIYGQFS
jgi:hypothetical protein